MLPNYFNKSAYTYNIKFCHFASHLSSSLHLFRFSAKQSGFSSAMMKFAKCIFWLYDGDNIDSALLLLPFRFALKCAFRSFYLLSCLFIYAFLVSSYQMELHSIPATLYVTTLSVFRNQINERIFCYQIFLLLVIRLVRNLSIDAI